MSPAAQGDAFFRHEYGRLVAMLVRRVGARHLEAIEDAVQSALLAALETWPTGGAPENPSAWLFRSAHNAVLGSLRSETRRARLRGRHRPESELTDAPEAYLAADVPDDLLRMLFVCCDPGIPIEAQLVLALKTLCGFGVREIAERLFLTEANVYKRLARARERLRRRSPLEGDLALPELASRAPAVRAVLYLMFTEGHLSSHADGAVRVELCDEAVRLAMLLSDHGAGNTAETAALLALMHLHRARTPARLDPAGGLVLLEEQDRAAWDADEIHAGLAWLERSASGDVLSRYHIEAAIAAEHSLAASFASTRWDRVIELYEQLERLAPSPLHRLNRAIATAEWRGAQAGLAVLDDVEPPTWLAGWFLWAAVLADLHLRAGHRERADRYRELALEAAPSPQLRDVLARRLAE
ncbi:RNA polymerase sigma factor [Sandaracinus amylolyticus]|uniref:RNA polymerase sigma factor n=1 Tax=Sandaracinus amylolyticus TaxID=927083 RepID=UPI001F02737E|nr:sigma-70 family RNA polymerase sigma factor [Sandaracinus amylolyticus]UJR81808.1 RNA polymerase sigma factor [Sandaracinus amylolyticus]